MIQTLSLSVLPVLMIVAGVGDTLSLRIPNKLVMLIAALFVPMAFLTGMPLADFALHVGIGLGLFCVGFALYLFGMFGGGDAKLLAAAGLWFGSADLVPFLVCTLLAGGLLALAVGAWVIISMSWEIHDAPMAERVKQLKPNVPYGFAMTIGALLAFPGTWWMERF